MPVFYPFRSPIWFYQFSAYLWPDRRSDCITVPSLIRDITCGPEVLFETCVAMKLEDDDGDDDEPMNVSESTRQLLHRLAFNLHLGLS